MDHIVGHVVRRGLEAGHATLTSPKAPKEPNYDFPEVPAWGAFLLLFTTIFFGLFLFVIEYTCGRVIATLSIVESPSGTLFEPLALEEPTSDPDTARKNANTNTVAPELLLVKDQPITAHLRTALKHLRSQAGVWSYFRGFSIYLVYNFLTTQVVALLSIPRIPGSVATIIAAVIFARLRMGWTHIVISEPSPKPWFRRLPSLKLWKKVALPTALLALCEQITVGIPVAFFYAMKLDKMDGDAFEKLPKDKRISMAFSIIAIGVLAIFCAVAIVVPATVTLIRVQASLLSDEEETIIPFDRSFGGKVVPEIVGGSGAIGMLEAWKTFDWASRVRLLKLYGKVGALQFITSVMFAVAIGTELVLILGPDGIQKAANFAGGAVKRQ